MALSNNNAVVIPAQPEEAEATNEFSIAELRDISDPVYIPPDLTWLWITLAVLSIAGLIYWIWRTWFRQGAAPPQLPPTTPPYRIALGELQAALTLIHDPEPFCTKVSNIVRVYLEDQLSLKAPERTTEEFLRELRMSCLLEDEQKVSLGRFLEQCDLVKFARHEPTETELRGLHDSAVRLVEETMPTGSVDTVEESE